MKYILFTTFAIFAWIPASTLANHARSSASDTTIHPQPDGSRIIVERIPGVIEIPDPPEPVVRTAPEPETAERLAELAAQWQAQRTFHPTIHAGASVYRLPDGKTVTHVRNFRVNNGPMGSFWSSADFSILAHPGNYSHPSPEGDVHYTMLLFWTLHDVATWKEWREKRGEEYQLPKVPDFPDGPATWIADEGGKAQQPDAATAKAINHLHQHHNDNLTELKAAYAKRIAEQAARRAELEANPPQPRDIHLRVGRLSREQAADWHSHATQRNGGAE